MSEVTASAETAEIGEPTRRDFNYVAATTTAIGAGAATRWPRIDQMDPSADTLGLASIEVDDRKAPLGRQIGVKWRNKPVFIRHRTNAETWAAVAGDQGDLRDPAADARRQKPGMPESLIVIGACTPLGRVPNFGDGRYHCWLCPRHGSDYDTAGRFRSGPAPRRLVLPDHAFESNTKARIG